MRESLPHIDQWLSQKKGIAIATVTDVFNSAPRGIGSKMVISSDGEMFGSVSAGCVEGAVVAEALQVIESGKARNLHYGIEDAQAWGVGLTCGGKIDIFVEPMAPSFKDNTQNILNEIRKAITDGTVFMLATVLEGEFTGKKMLLYVSGEHYGSTGSPALDEALLRSGLALLKQYHSARLTLDVNDGTAAVFFDLNMPPERLVVMGATHIAMHLVTMAKGMGYHTIVIDPRAAFISEDRFPDVDEMHKAWPQDVIPGLKPDPSTYLVILTHDAKLDLPALEAGLKHPFRYIGLLGSRTTQADRKAELIKMGYNEKQIASIYGPIGISIGSRLPDEIAVSILAEIIAVRRGVLSKIAA